MRLRVRCFLAFIDIGSRNDVAPAYASAHFSILVASEISTHFPNPLIFGIDPCKYGGETFSVK